MGLSGPYIIDGRYAIYDEIASGGMATVHFGCLLGAGSFSRVVAVKRLHTHLQREREFVAMFMDEARVAARIRHPNVAPTLDVVGTDREIFLVMEYVHGESLAKLFAAMRARREPMPLPVAAAILVGVLGGLHAAHEATDERGLSLRIVHRDVSPQNLIVGVDGIARIVDFGIAKAVGRLQQTQTGEIKGKFGYMAPEQVNGQPVTRAADVYAAGVVLWEALTGATLFSGDSDVALAAQVLLGNVSAPSCSVPGVPPVFDDITMCALERDPARRFATARDMARALETSVPLASASQVAAWVENLAGPVLRRREQRLWEIERDWAARTGALERTPSALPIESRRDASTGAVTYAAGMESGTRVEGMRRGAQDASNLLDTQDHPPPPRAHAGLPLGIWVALAAGATIAAAGVVDRRGDLVGLLHRTPTATSAGSTAPGPSPVPGPTTASRPPTTAPTTAPAPPGVTASPAPVTVSVESLPVAEPSTISIDALPRAPGAAPSGPATRRSRPRRH
jgi:eukaryotic-like serine/threonine-protein kinase